MSKCVDAKRHQYEVAKFSGLKTNKNEIKRGKAK